MLIHVTYLVTSAQKMPLTTYLEEIESSTNYVINYNRSATDTFYLKYDFEKDFSIERIASLFAQTPFDISINDHSLILIPPEENALFLYGLLTSEEGEALPFANIYIDDDHGFETDAFGNFYYSYSGDKSTCKITYIGYEELEVSLNQLTKGALVPLKRMGFLFPESIVIRSYVKKEIDEGKSFGSLDIDLSKDKNGILTDDQDLFRSLQNLPGIDSPDETAANLNIRGGSADHNLITWEGVPLYDNGYLSGMVSSVNPFSLKRVEINKSSFSAEKNSRIGGSIDMRLDDKPEDQISLSSGLNLTEGHFNLSMPLLDNKIGLILAGRKSLFTEFEANPTLQSFGRKIFQTKIGEEDEQEEIEEEEVEPKISYYDINAKVIFNVNEKITISSSFLNAQGRNENLAYYNAVSLRGNEALETSSSALANSVRFFINQENIFDITHTLSSYKSENETQISEDGLTSNFLSKEEVSNRINDQQFRLIWRNERKKIKTNIGYIFDVKRTKIKSEFESDVQPSTEEEVEIDGTFHHLFVDQSISFKNQYLEYGLRATYANDLASGFLSPSISYRYNLGHNLIFKANAGIHHQFIRQIYNTVEESFNEESVIWSLNADKDEPVLNALKTAVGANYRKGQWLFDIEGYVHKTSGLAAENPVIRNTITLDQENQLLSKGVDLLINWESDQWSTSVFYSISDNTITLPFVFEDESGSFPANNNQRHKLRINNTYRYKTFDFGLTYHYKSGLPFSNEVSVETSQDDDEKYELLYSSINNETLNSYHRVDFSINHHGKWKRVNYDIGCSLLNILDRTNIESRKSILTTSDASTEPSILEVRKNLLPRTLMFFARVDF